jgi:hypothetical protein
MDRSASGYVPLGARGALASDLAELAKLRDELRSTGSLDIEANIEKLVPLVYV